MKLHLSYISYLFFFSVFLLGGCRKESPASTDAATFIARADAANNGDYLATYPLSSPDSCIARVKAEVPASLQPWACLSIWYHMPRTSPKTSFRLLELYEENYPHDTVTAFAQMMRGEFYMDLAKFDSARTCLLDAYQGYTRLNRPLDASDATFLLARIHTYQNDFPKAIQKYMEVLDLLNAQDTSFSFRHASLYRDLSVAYERSNNKQQQLRWLQKAWSADLSKLDHPWRYKVSIASNLSGYYLKENPDSSLAWAKMALDIHAKENPHSPPSPRIVYWLARAYFKKGDCATALPHFLDAYRRNPDKNSLFGFYQFGHALGECYLCIGKLDSAELYLREALGSPDTGNLAVAHNLLSDVHARRGDWKNALAEAKESRRLFEIKFNTDKMKALADLDARYDAAQKERRIAELEQQHKNSRQQALITALSLVLALGLSLALLFRQRGQRRILKQENLLLEQEKKLLEQEKLLVEAQGLLHAQELERSRTDLKATQEELGSTNRLLDLKSQLIEELQMRLTYQNPAHTEGNGLPHMQNKALLGMKILTKPDWEQFRFRFDESFPGFLRFLQRQFPSLTHAETRLFLLIKLDFDNDEIAQTLGIAKESVWKTRLRLCKKLGISESSDLTAFVQSFDQASDNNPSPPS